MSSANRLRAIFSCRSLSSAFISASFGQAIPGVGVLIAEGVGKGEGGDASDSEYVYVRSISQKARGGFVVPARLSLLPPAHALMRSAHKLCAAMRNARTKMLTAPTFDVFNDRDAHAVDVSQATKCCVVFERDGPLFSL